jgi:energy-coupling factor transporter ATP-binding protein EcfA2
MCTTNTGFRAVITGKGGVGKTTLTSCLATALSRNGITVLAVDEDPQMNLPYALGLGVERAAGIVPLNMNKEYIEEKTGINPAKNSWGAMFKLNPDVDDVVERFGMHVADKLNLLVMGTVKQAGEGASAPKTCSWIPPYGIWPCVKMRASCSIPRPGSSISAGRFPRGSATVWWSPMIPSMP